MIPLINHDSRAQSRREVVMKFTQIYESMSGLLDNDVCIKHDRSNSESRGIRGSSPQESCKFLNIHRSEHRMDSILLVLAG